MESTVVKIVENRVLWCVKWQSWAKKYQANIPEPVRKLLHLKTWDEIAFDIEDDDVHLRKARPVDLAFAQSIEGTLTEWTTEVDEEAYRDL